MLFPLSQLDNSVKTQLRNPKKVYAVDNALIRRLGFHFSGEEGRLLENLVYVELRRRGGEIFYHNSGKAECDFVVRDGFRVCQAIQVCFLMDDPDTRERELRGLFDALNAYNLSEGTIVTNAFAEEVTREGKSVHILPAWKWLLEA